MADEKREWDIFQGDGNDGTFYRYTLRNATADEAEAHIRKEFFEGKDEDDIMDDGDDQYMSLYLADEGAFGASSLVVDAYVVGSGGREPMYDRNYHEFE
jgi:hypothetical protein